MEEDDSSAFVSDGTIHSVKFSISTADEIRTVSVSDCPVSHPSQLTNPFLGLPLESGRCESCGTAEHGKCEGHFGYIQLPIPIYHPSHVSELGHILSLVCLKCLRMKKGKVKHNRGKEVSCSTLCLYCRDLPPISIKEMKKDDALWLQLEVPSKRRLQDGFWRFLDKFGYHHGDSDTYCRSLLAHEALNILKKMPEETKRRLAGKGYYSQNGFILECLPVPPNCLYIPEISDGKSIMSSDISISMLKKILNKIELIRRSRSGSPNFESHEIEAKDLQSSIAQYMLCRGTTKAPHDLAGKFSVQTAASECSGKQWLEKMRTLFISKGSGFSSRSVITGDSYIGVDKIGLPSEIAQRVTFEERVTTSNMARLQKMVDEGLCVTYKDGRSTYAIAVGSKGHTVLKIGQVVHRQVVDGDIVFLNRPPSTHKHSLQAFSVFVHEDHTVKVNPLICAPLGADFDGDCVHIFYPQSLASKAEVVELFSVEKQMLCSHNGNLNLQLAHDALLGLKSVFKTFFFGKATAQQLAMFASSVLPPAAIIKGQSSRPFWTVLQILQGAFTDMVDCKGENHLIQQSEILKVNFDRDSVQAIFNEIVTSILMMKGPKEALNFFNVLQPLLMEILCSDGFSITLKDFDVPKDMIEDVHMSFQVISHLLYQSRSLANELLHMEVEKHMKITKMPIAAFALNLSAMGELVDSRSDSSITKVVQQLGFLGLQLYERGKLYSKTLVDDIFSHFVKKYSMIDVDQHSPEAYGLVKNSFFHGLNPYEALVHSISSREVIVRSSRGLTEPGTLFKNLMAVLRDVSICYDGTVRNHCNDSIVQFEYAVDVRPSSLSVSVPGEPVGVLAATAISNPAYKAVLDSSQSTISSWDLMKEILLCKGNFRNDLVDRRVILYLNDCLCGKKYCKENAAFTIQNCLKKITLKDCAIDFSIEYQSQISHLDGSETASGLVGHIHLDEIRVKECNQNMDEILLKCQEVMFKYRKMKKSNLSNFFKKTTISAGACNHQSDEWSLSQTLCIQFSYCDGTESIERAIDFMANLACPVLLDTVIKGDPRVNLVNIVWIEPDASSWVRNSGNTLKGEVAVEVVIEKDQVRKKGDTWRTALDACLPVVHLIDTRRSIPYAIQQIQELFGISCAFEQSVQRLSKSIRMVSKGVLKEHLTLVGNSMTCSGNLIGFNTGGFKALFRSMKVQVPFTEATLYTPMKCFERAADKCYADPLSSIVSSCSWGKPVAVGTGTRFQILWDKNKINDKGIGKDVYDFLGMVRTVPTEAEGSNGYLGLDVDNFAEDDMECFSPGRDEKAIFDDDAADQWNSGGLQNEAAVATGWENVSAPAIASDSWNGWVNGNRLDAEDKKLETAKPNAWSSWDSDSEQRPVVTKEKNESHSWDKNVLETARPNPQSSWVSDSEQRPVVTQKRDESHSWDKNVLETAKPNSQSSWASDSEQRPVVAQEKDESHSWDKNVWNTNSTSNLKSQPGGWGTSSTPVRENKNNETQDGGHQGRKTRGWGSPNEAVTQEKDESHSWDKNAWNTNSTSNPKSQPGGWGTSSTPVKENTNHETQDGGNQGWKTRGWGSPNEAVTQEKDESHSWDKNAWNTNSASNPKSQPGGLGTSSTPVKENTNNEIQGGGHQGWKSRGSGSPNEAVTQEKDESHSWDKNAWNTNSASNPKSQPGGWGTSSTPVKENTNNETQDGGHQGWKSRGWGSPNDAVTQEKDESHSWDKNAWNTSSTSNPKSQPGGWGTSSTQVKENTNNETQDGGHQGWKSRGWGSSNDAGSRFNRNRSSGPMQSNERKGWKPPSGNFTPTPRRFESFTPEEETILVDVQPTIDTIRRILRDSSEGAMLAEDDQKFITERVFHYHPDRQAKIADQIDHIMVDRPQNFQDSRCFFVVSSDGSRQDFSYIKCVENFVRQRFPEHGESFNKKYFKKRRAEPSTPKDESQQL